MISMNTPLVSTPAPAQSAASSATTAWRALSDAVKRKGKRRCLAQRFRRHAKESTPTDAAAHHPPRPARAFSDKYRLDAHGTLGDGFNGKVVRAVNCETGEEVAVKVLADCALSMREIECQRRGTESTVVCILDVFCNESATEWNDRLDGVLPPRADARGRVIVVVMELMKGGELFNRVVNSSLPQGRLDESDARIVAVHLAEALAQLHESGVVHQDVKLENILLRSPDSLDLKLCDFGFASFDAIDGVKCTTAYAAPEVIQNIVSRGARGGHAVHAVTSAIDCWSLGVVLYICLGGRFPFKTHGSVITREFKKANQSGVVTTHGPVWDTVSNAAKSVILGLLTVDPDMRMSAKDVLNHPWLLDLAAERAHACAAAGPPSTPPPASQKSLMSTRI